MIGNLFTHQLHGIAMTDIMAPSAPGILTGVAGVVLGLGTIMAPKLREHLEQKAVSVETDKQALPYIYGCAAMDAAKAMNLGKTLKSII